MFLSILLAIYDIGPHIMGGERVTRAEWLHIAAPLVAVIGILMALIAYGFAAQKTVVASSRDRDVYFDCPLRVRPRRAEFDSSLDHVASDHQRFGVWCRVCLVLLSQAKCRRIFSRITKTQSVADGTQPWTPTSKLSARRFGRRDARPPHRPAAAVRPVADWKPMLRGGMLLLCGS